jgi:hypothetical protein
MGEVLAPLAFLMIKAPEAESTSVLVDGGFEAALPSSKNQFCEYL